MLGAGSARADTACAMSRVDFRGQGLRESFAIELADTPQSRARGLMFRKSLAADAGMLFIYDTPHPVQFWMKNTLIPLDMIFMDDRGRVRSVHENATPGDLTPIDGGDGIQFVLEIKGGLARRVGIAPGSEMRHPAIGASAHWRCAS